MRSPGNAETVEHLYTTGEVASLLGIPSSTLKEWERRGYLSPPARAGQRRRYSEAELKCIVRVQALTRKYRYREQVLAAVAAGEALDMELPPALRPVSEPPSVSELAGGPELERLLDLAAVNAELFAEQRRAFKRVAAAEEAYRLLLESSPDIIAGIDATGIVRYVNPAVAILGSEPCDLAGRHFADVLRQWNSSSIEESLWLVLSGKVRTLHRQLEVPRRGRAVTLDVKAATMMKNDRPSGAVVIARDISGGQSEPREP
ncbi:MAG: PAS domain S-box protein [Chloroflexi bacterium]|nr:PAS domain S-box protein [Chloroflexota bacterium]